jgi:hypothetical protein
MCAIGRCNQDKRLQEGNISGSDTFQFIPESTEDFFQEVILIDMAITGDENIRKILNEHQP